MNIKNNAKFGISHTRVANQLTKEGYKIFNCGVNFVVMGEIDVDYLDQLVEADSIEYVKKPLNFTSNSYN